MYLDREIIKEKYNYYVQYYNTTDDPVAASSSLLTIKKGVKERLDELNDKTDIRLEDLEYYLNKVCDENFNSSNEEATKFEDYSAKNCEQLNEHIMEHIKWEVSHQYHISKPTEFLEYNSEQLKKFYELYEEKEYFDKSIRLLNTIIWYGEQFKRASYHLKGIKTVTNRIIDEDYPEPLVYYENLDEIEKEDQINLSNADKLYVAREWLYDLIKQISSIDEPTHSQVFELIRTKFPEFEGVPHEIDLSFTKGHNNLNKTSIDKALTYLFNQKHEKNISEGTIKRRFDEYCVW